MYDLTKSINVCNIMCELTKNGCITSYENAEMPMSLSEAAHNFLLEGHLTIIPENEKYYECDYYKEQDSKGYNEALQRFANYGIKNIVRECINIFKGEAEQEIFVKKLNPSSLNGGSSTKKFIYHQDLIRTRFVFLDTCNISPTWKTEYIFTKMQEFPDGVCGKFIDTRIDSNAEEHSTSKDFLLFGYTLEEMYICIKGRSWEKITNCHQELADGISEMLECYKTKKEVNIITNVKMLRYEIFEDNGGGITMFVLDTNGTPIWGHSGYEFVPNQLKKDITILQNTNSVEDWDGNGVYSGINFTSWNDIDGGLQGCYDELKNDEYVDLIADSDGIYPNNMSTVAAEAFGVEID